MEVADKQFAITAHCLGHPRKLFTPITILNLGPTGLPKAAKVNAMWDTGAETCLMTLALANKLGYTFDRIIPAHGLTGSANTPIGYVYVSLVGGGEVISVMTAIINETSPDRDYSFIIGLDLIRRGTLAITSTAIDTTLSFVVPASQTIDFLKLSNIPTDRQRYLPLSTGHENADVIVGDDALALLGGI